MTDSSSGRMVPCPSTEAGPLQRQRAGQRLSGTQRSHKGPRPEGSLLLSLSPLWAQPRPAWLISRVLDTT